MKLQSLRSAGSLAHKRVIIRVDYNVPLSGKKILDDFKILQSIPTITYALAKKAQVILISHLGRPVGVDLCFSLQPVCTRLSKLLGRKVVFSSLDAMLSGGRDAAAPIVLLENIRFDRGEEKNDPVLVKRLANIGDIFVLDGFGVSHRAAASVVGVARRLPAYAGLLLEKEIGSLNRVLTKPKKPFVVVLGGTKMETKIPVLKKVLPLADYILLGGGIATTYYLAEGYPVGASVVQKEFLSLMKSLSKNKKIILPIDAVYGTEQGAKVGVVTIGPNFKLPSGVGIYDIGPATAQLFASYIEQAATIVWNGALGFFEQPPYHYGTYTIAECIARRAKRTAFRVAGGGETVEILEKLGVTQDFDLVSTGGGAMLEYLSGKKLPGIMAVSVKNTI